MTEPAGSFSQAKKRKGFDPQEGLRSSQADRSFDRDGAFGLVSKEVPVTHSPTLPRTPASVTTARVVVHLARLVAVLSVAAQAGMVGVQAGWVVEGRMALADLAGGHALLLVLSVGGALAVWWLAARVLASTRML